MRRHNWNNEQFDERARHERDADHDAQRGPGGPGQFGPGGFGPGGFGPRNGGFGPEFGRGPGFGPGRGGCGPQGDEFERGGRGSRGRGRGRGRRGVQRGDVRIAVLKLLESEPMHGYQIVSSIEHRTSGAWKPSPGAIYPTLSQLEDEGLITIERENGRKVATLTDSGREYIAQSLSEVDPFAGFAGGAEERGHLRESVHELMEVTRRVGRTGDAAQIAAVDTIIGESIKQIYLLLAGADRTPPGTPVESESAAAGSDDESGTEPSDQ